jgi:hypothetical protein
LGTRRASGMLKVERHFIQIWVNQQLYHSRCLPFSKWLPKHGLKMGRKNSTLSDIIKI